MTYPSVQFVESPDDDAEVRFDLNTIGEWADGEVWPRHEGVSLGAPSLAGDPDGIGTQYGFRQLTFDLIVAGTHSAASKAVSGLALELQRQTNWLRVQLTELSEPIWFKTYRSAPSALSFENVTGTDDADEYLWGVSVQLDADPRAYGRRVELPAVTVANDVTGTNPLSWTLPEILGDSETPLTLSLMPSATVKTHMLLSVAQVPTFATPYVVQSAAFNAYEDTSAEIANAAYSGGGYREMFGTVNVWTENRVTANLPVMPPGRYKILARVARSDTTSAFTIRVDVGTLLAADSLGEKVVISGTSASTSWASLVDMGDFDLPAAASGGSPHGLTGIDQTAIHLHGERNSGTGKLRVDYFLAVPVQSEALPSSTLAVAAVNPIFGGDPMLGRYDLHVDGELERAAYGGTFSFAADKLASTQPPSLKGGFPTVHPGTGNVVTLLHHVTNTAVNDAAYNDSIALTTDVAAVSYQPRWLYLAGV